MTVTPEQIATLKSKALKAAVLGNVKLTIEGRPGTEDVITYCFYASPERILHLIAAYERTAPQMGECPRCGLGIDNSGNGDCVLCRGKSDAQVMRESVENMRFLAEELDLIGLSTSRPQPAQSESSGSGSSSQTMAEQSPRAHPVPAAPENTPAGSPASAENSDERGTSEAGSEHAAL